jgi:hypothetical protein
MNFFKFFAGGVVVAASLSPLAAGSSDVPDRDALAASVAGVRSSLHSFDATAAAVVLEGIPGAIESMEVRHAWEDGRIRLERTHPVGSTDATFKASYDGHVYWTYQGMNQVAARLVQPNAHFMRGGYGLFELMAFFPDVAGLEGELGSDLEHMLWHGNVSIRSDWDAVGEWTASLSTDLIEGGWFSHSGSTLPPATTRGKSFTMRVMAPCRSGSK